MAALMETKTQPVPSGGCFALAVSLLENYCPCARAVSLGLCRSSIKAGTFPHSHIHCSCLLLLGNKVSLKPSLYPLLLLLLLL